MKLSGYNTLITGGSQGFGRHIVEAFIAEGANVVFCARTAAEAIAGAHAVVICTEWPELRDYDWPALLASMAKPVVVDANRLVEKAVAAVPSAVYLTVGRP